MRGAILRLESHLLASRAMRGTARNSNPPSRLRQLILQRTRRAVQSARPHDRMRIASLAECARLELLGRIGAHADRELSALRSLGAPDDLWLESVIACLRNVPHRIEAESAERPEVMAIILFDVSDQANGLSSATER
jgi:hypothetical protein